MHRSSIDFGYSSSQGELIKSSINKRRKKEGEREREEEEKGEFIHTFRLNNEHMWEFGQRKEGTRG